MHVIIRSMRVRNDLWCLVERDIQDGRINAPTLAGSNDTAIIGSCRGLSKWLEFTYLRVRKVIHRPDPQSGWQTTRQSMQHAFFEDRLASLIPDMTACKG